MLYNVFTTTFTDLRSKTNNNRHGDRDREFSHLVTMKKQAESQRYMDRWMEWRQRLTEEVARENWVIMCPAAEI